MKAAMSRNNNGNNNPIIRLRMLLSAIFSICDTIAFMPAADKKAERSIAVSGF